MTESGRPYGFVYMHIDVPEGMTIRAWRAEQAAAGQATRGKRARVRRIARTLGVTLSRVRVGEVRHSSGARGSIQP